MKQQYTELCHHQSWHHAQLLFLGNGAVVYISNISQSRANEDHKITDKWRQSSIVPIFEAFVWLNGKDWLNGNTFNYYWEARSACTAWRGPSFYKAPWTQREAASLRQPVNVNSSLRGTKMKKERNGLEWSTCGLWMSLQLLQHEILCSHASVIRSGPVTCSWYLSLIGHSLFTGIVKDADLYNITLTHAGKFSQWKW